MTVHVIAPESHTQRQKGCQCIGSLVLRRLASEILVLPITVSTSRLWPCALSM